MLIFLPEKKNAPEKKILKTAREEKMRPGKKTYRYNWTVLIFFPEKKKYAPEKKIFKTAREEKM